MKRTNKMSNSIQEIKAPELPESVSEGSVGLWHKQVGDSVLRDEVLVEIETDKVAIEVPAISSGVLREICQPQGAVVASGTLLGRLEAQESGVAAPGEPPPGKSRGEGVPPPGPAVRKLLQERRLSPEDVAGTGKGGRITKSDVLRHRQKESPPKAPAAAPAAASAAPVAKSAAPAHDASRPERRVPMTRLRARIAERMMLASQTTAMLTTFNEVNMQPMLALRKRYQERFQEIYGVRLGLMSFFVQAVGQALQRYPDVNASIDGEEIVYHGYQDIGVAVAVERGLVVPVLRNAERLSFAEIEKQLREFSSRAQENKLTMEEITGGTFTITNGGVFGSLMSTPILNPPQTGILGMHRILERPVAVEGEVCILPMMYLALSYDHRLIDGKEAVQFLLHVKEQIEDPARILLGL